MGARGPAPKTTTTRRRTNEPTVPVKRAAKSARVVPPKPDAKWHPVAKRWFNSLVTSGQSKFYEDSDWGLAYLLAESMSRDLAPQFVGFTEKGEILKDNIPLKGASLTAYLRGMTSLLVTEGDRRRAMVELQHGEVADPDKDRAKASVTLLRSKVGG